MLTKTLYHGSDKKVDTLKPMGINMGHRWQEPHWATYFWGTPEEAVKWAIYQYCRRQLKLSLMYYIPTGGFILTEAQYREVCAAAVGGKCYIYKAEVPFYEVGIGSSPHIKEFTVKGEVKPKQCTTLVIDQKALFDCAVIASSQEIEQYKIDIGSGKYDRQRGLVYSWVLDPDKDFKRHQYHKRIKDGTLKPGDPLGDLSIESYPPSSQW